PFLRVSLGLRSNMKCGVTFCAFLSLFGLSYGFVSSLTPPSDNNEIDEAAAREEIERNRLSLSDLQDRFTSADRVIAILVENALPKGDSPMMHPNICQLRLEFEKFSLLGPNAESLCERDTFTVVGAAGENPQVICGENAGQHMIIDLPSGYGSSRINIATSTSGPRRSWRIKAQQIECNSPYRAPQNCLQYFTSYSNTISSFNFKEKATAGSRTRVSISQYQKRT
ncbi:hypothetical protein Anas_03408, partial [Armadillidium nasatum]